MPCYDPRNEELQKLPELFLCKACQRLSSESILSVAIEASDGEIKTLADWYIEHLEDEAWDICDSKNKGDQFMYQFYQSEIKRVKQALERREKENARIKKEIKNEKLEK